MAEPKSITFSVEGMSCNHCKHSIEKAVKSLDGVTGAVIDIEQGVVNITFDQGAVEKEALVGAIEAAGYKILQ